MSDRRYAWAGGAPAATVSVTVDGEACELPAERSLLAGLLAGDAGRAVEYFCAIGQCQRCIVRVNGRERVACLVRPAAGDVVETRGDRLRGRLPHWQ